jgi:chitodextrinase
MKTKRRPQWQARRVSRRIPGALQIAELVIGLVLFSAFGNLWAVLAGADPDVTPPSVPANLQVSGRAANEIDLSWDASTDDTAVTGYHVYRGGTLIASPTTTVYDDTNVTPSTNYSYTVSAFDAASNESAQSSPLNTTTLADTSPPSVPANVHEAASTTSSISLAWNPSADNIGTTGYNIYRNGIEIKTQTGTTFTDSGLAVYSGYNYRISAFDAAGNTSNLSNTFVGSTSPDVTPPSVPDNITEPSHTVSSVTLQWDTSTDDVGVAGYHVYRGGSLVGTVGGPNFTDTGLTVSSNYDYTISAYDAAGNESAQSAVFSARSSDDTTPPTTPTSVHVTATYDTSLDLAWNASTDDVGVVGYKIYRDGSLVGTTTSPTVTFDDTSLSPVTTYHYTVVAYDAANNNSPASTSLAATTAYDTTPPSVPGGLATTAKTDQSISLQWNASTDNVGVNGYDVYRDGTLITSTVGTSYTDSGLTVSTTYHYTVRAHDASGNNSAQSSVLPVTTLADLVAPTTPTNLMADSQTTTSVSLTWTAATDDVGVVSYNVYRGGSFIANVASPGYVDNNLRYNTSFGYAVTALDAAGNESPASSTVNTATLPDTTPPSVSLTAPSNGTTTELTFPISATASDDLDLNRVEFYVDGTLINTISSAPFSFNWNSYAVHNGSHTITAKAIDASGNYATQSVTVTITNPPPALLGDLNGDHKVNIYDLSILLSHWGKSGAGDFNNNGKVDIFDLSVLLSHYGQNNSNYN